MPINQPMGIPQGGPLTEDFDLGGTYAFENFIAAGSWSATGIYSDGFSLYLSGDLLDQSNNSFESLFNGNGGFVQASNTAFGDQFGLNIAANYALQNGVYNSMAVGFANSASFADSASSAPASGGSADFATEAGSADNPSNVTNFGGYDLTSLGNPVQLPFADDSSAPTNTVTPTGWFRLTVNGSEVWSPYYE